MTPLEIAKAYLEEARRRREAAEAFVAATIEWEVLCAELVRRSEALVAESRALLEGGSDWSDASGGGLGR